MSPKVSVVMAVYNGERYLHQAVTSILTQTLTDFEFIIINDASTDKTASLLKDFAASDSRIRLIENPENIGLTRSLNRGLEAAQGEYIARQDADDIALPHRFAEQVDFLDAHSHAVLLSGDIEIIDSDGSRLGIQKRAADSLLINWGMLFYNYIGGHSQVMFRREAALQVGGYAEDHRYSQDYELWLRLMRLGELIVLPKVWVQWRSHDKSLSSQQPIEQEHLSLTDSQKQLSMLLGRNIHLSEVALLRAFWLEPFPPLEQASQVNNLLWQVYQAFCKRESLHQQSKNLLRRHISEQFNKWARAVSLRRKPSAKLKILACTFGWSVRG